MKACLFFACLLACLSLGCSNETASKGGAAPPTSAVQAGSAQAEESVPPPPGQAGPATSEAPAEAAVAAPPSDEEMPDESFNHDILALQPVVDEYMNYTKKNPKDLEELRKAGYLKAIPTAPKGKKYIIDQNTFLVKEVAQ